MFAFRLAKCANYFFHAESNLTITNRNKLLQEWRTREVRLAIIRHSLYTEIGTESFSRKENLILLRLAIGHTRLIHSYLSLGKRSPVRPRYRNCPLSVGHILEECPTYIRNRRGLEGSICEFLALGPNNKSEIIHFLYDIRIFQLVQSTVNVNGRNRASSIDARV